MPPQGHAEVVSTPAPRRSITRPSAPNVEALAEICSVMQATQSWFAERKMASTPDMLIRVADLTLRLAKDREDAEKREAFERRNGIDA